jgi:uncharacterized integral membrane protein (TIGR00697 family)
VTKINYSQKEIAKKVLMLLLCLYLSINLASNVLSHNLVKLTPTLVINSSALCYTFTYFINDIITEVFGLSQGKFSVWLGILSDWIFTWLIVGIISLKSPDGFPLSAQYHAVLDPMARIPLIGIPAIIIGRFANIYFLSKMKILLNSRFFWFRSILSSCLGAVFHTIFIDFFLWVGLVGYSTIASIIFFNSMANIFTILFLSWIPLLFVYFVKNKLGIDEFDYKEKFNPFTL